MQLRESSEYARVETTAEWLYADAHGMSLYVNSKDRAGVSPACTAECARTWTAAQPQKGATAGGGWSILARADGTRQWALHDSALYRYAGDKAAGDTTGDGIEGGAWHAAVFRPGDGIVLPDGIAVREIADAGGAGLTDATGMTLYSFDGDPERSSQVCGAGECDRSWSALQAPEIANPVGDFSVIARADGISQWSFRGRPLYTFGGDRNPGDAGGLGVDSRFRAALILRFFIPPNAAIRRSLGVGSILVTRSGAALYERDRVTTEELHQFRSDHGSPALGRSLGTSTCDAKCAKTWQPFTAPETALPCGCWDVVRRDDGTRQWAFKGFALYTFAAEKPGDLQGNGVYTLEDVGGSEPGDAAQGAAAGTGLGAMFWHAVVP